MNTFRAQYLDNTAKFKIQVTSKILPCIHIKHGTLGLRVQYYGYQCFMYITKYTIRYQ